MPAKFDPCRAKRRVVGVFGCFGPCQLVKLQGIELSSSLQCRITLQIYSDISQVKSDPQCILEFAEVRFSLV